VPLRSPNPQNTSLFIGDILSLVVSYEVRNKVFCNKLKAASNQCCNRLGSSAYQQNLFLAVSKLQCTQVPKDGEGIWKSYKYLQKNLNIVCTMHNAKS